MQPSMVSTTSLVVQQILDQYACVLAEPMEFPTSIPGHDHIPLLPRHIPRNIRPIPTRVWIDISIVLIEGIPTSCGKIMILVVVDRLSTYSHFCALIHSYVASLVTHIVMDQIFHDATFTSHFLSKQFHHTGTKMQMSLGYHPKKNGHTEFINKCLETHLRCFTSEQ